MNRDNRKSIVIIEPSLIVQKGIRSMLEREGEFEVVNSFTDHRSYLDSPSSRRPDIIIINPLLVNFHKQFHVKNFFPDHSETSIIGILYSFVDPETLESFDGVIDIYDDGETIVKKIKRAIAEHKNEDTTEDGIDLSDREKEILVAVANGMTNKEIAEKHNISVHTVISHRKNITRKTGIKTVSGLTIYALLNNLISQNDLKH